MSLADELLADLEEGGEEEELVEEAEKDGDAIDDIEEVDESMAELDYSRVTAIARFPPSLTSILLLLTGMVGQAAGLNPVQAADGASGGGDGDGARRGPRPRRRRPRVSHHRRGQRPPPSLPSTRVSQGELGWQANNVSAEIDGEIATIHKFTRDKYKKRFPELESLVPNPLEYMALAAEMGNAVLEKSTDKDLLSSILLPATVIVVSVTATTTKGEDLSEDELAAVSEACQMARDLQDARVRLFQFVESRMGFVAPNLSAVAGSAGAAKLIGVAGGLTDLSKMPACNILVLGAQKRTLSGFSSTAVLPHAGFVYYSPLVQGLPPDLRSKGARLLAAKCALAARVDSVHASPDGEAGRELLAEIQKKVEKMLEPPPVKKVKALPKPLDQSSKKRGGRRARKNKERLGLTEMRKKANRVSFGDLEEDVIQTDIGFSLGQIKRGPLPLLLLPPSPSLTAERPGLQAGRGRRCEAPWWTTSPGPACPSCCRRRWRGPITGRRRWCGAWGARWGRGRPAPAAPPPCAPRRRRGRPPPSPSRPSRASRSSTPTPTRRRFAHHQTPTLPFTFHSALFQVDEANAKYFANTSSFLKVKTPLPGGKKDA